MSLNFFDTIGKISNEISPNSSTLVFHMSLPIRGNARCGDSYERKDKRVIVTNSEEKEVK